ncbi:MAG: hypothetical protein WBE11_09900 [Candidatus Aminicenantaceae bacterium]
MEFCCVLFDNHFKEGFLKRKRYFVSGEEGVSSSETGHYFAELVAQSDVESKTIKMPLNYCPFCGERLAE